MTSAEPQDEVNEVMHEDVDDRTSSPDSIPTKSHNKATTSNDRELRRELAQAKKQKKAICISR